MNISNYNFRGNYIYAVTFTTHNRLPIFDDQNRAMIMTSCIMTGRALQHYWLLCFVVMPDHVHVILKPRIKEIFDCVGYLKGASSRILNKIAGESRQTWQRRYFSRPIVQIELLLKEIEYIENNPAKAGIRIDPFDYLFSSINIRDALDIDMIDESIFWQEPASE